MGLPCTVSYFFLPWSFSSVQFSSFQSLSRVRLFATPWIAARQTSLSIEEFVLVSIEAVMPSSHLISSPSPPAPQSLPASESFPMSQLFAWGGQRTGVSALASFLPKNTQGWSPSEWTAWISLQSKGLSRVFSNTTVQKHQFFSAQPSSQSNSCLYPIHYFSGKIYSSLSQVDRIDTWPRLPKPPCRQKLTIDYL